MNGLGQDVRLAFRMLWKNPAFAAVVILTLGLGIGANAAIFSLMDQVLLRALPVKDPSALVVLDGPGAFRGRTFNSMTFSYPMYKDLRDRTEVFDGILASFQSALTLTHGGRSERVTGDLVSGNYFEVLGVRAAIGRTLTPEDDRVPGGHPVAMLSHGFWTRRFGASPAVLNETIQLNGHAMTVVGVAAPGFQGIEVGASPDVMVPVTMKAQMTPTWNDLDNRASRWLTVMARLEPGVTRDQAETAMNVVYRQINEVELQLLADAPARFRERFLAKRLELYTGARGRSSVREQLTTPLVVLMGMVGLVLLIACANVANLLLARSASRQRETAIRLALGAGRGRIVRQQLVESLILAVAGGTFGLLVSGWTARLILSAMPGDGSAQALSASPDLRVLAFAAVVSLATAVVFGTAPAWQSARARVTTALKEEAGSVAGGTRQARLRKSLVIAQVALSMMLLAGAGVFARSLYNLKSLNVGFQADELLAFSLDPSLSGYSQTRILQTFERLQDELSAVPGVTSAGLAQLGALTGDAWQMTVRVDGYQAKEGEDMNPYVNGVSPRYFSTLGIPLVSGREFTAQDAPGAPRVAIVNETFARYFFGEGPAVGRRLGFGRSPASSIEIVGVVKDTREASLRSETPRNLYLPYRQETELGFVTFYIRHAAGAPPAAAIRRTAEQLDASLPVFNLKSVTTQVNEFLFVERLVALLSAAFGALATALAAIGLYGVMTYAVARRTREIGIRMALGAARTTVLWLVLREVTVMAAIGIMAGGLAAVPVLRMMRTQLYGLSPTDPVALIGAVLTLTLVALAAGFVPARRATALDPMRALRSE